MISRNTYSLSWGRHRLELGVKTAIMGVVNVTPDSFSDGGHFFSTDTAVAQGRKLADEGADIIDIGGESTRPYSEPVSVKEELQRVIPVIQTLAEQVPIPISIDTTKAEVARAALDAGATIINDISALRLDPDLGKTASEYGVPIILMHMLGTPKTMQVAPEYGNLIGEIRIFLEEAANRAVAAGVPRNRIIIDPGIGFGKTFDHNLSLLQQLGRFRDTDFPILVGPSRKAFIRHLLKGDPDSDLSPMLPEVETGTQAAVAASILNGAHIVRVHDVGNTRSTATTMDAIVNAPL